jgi:DNA-binding GntR family transcriptional regulator
MTFSEVVTSNTRRDFLRDALREAILKGKLAPGEPINQVTLSKEFKVSRGPLREALNLLEKEGLVTNIPYHGTFVAAFDDRIIEDTYGLRRVLEQFAVEMAMKRGMPSDLTELRSIYEHMAAAVEDNDMETFHGLDLAFHRQIYVIADHELLLHMWASLEANVARSIFYGNYQHQDDSPQMMLNSHCIILETIESGDIEAAKCEVDFQLKAAGEKLVTKWRRYNSTNEKKKE